LSAAITSFGVCSSRFIVSFGVQAKVILEAGRRLFEHVDVGAGADEFLTRAGQHDHVHTIVHARGQNGIVYLAHHFVGIRIGRRVVELDDGDAVGDAVADLLVIHARRFDDLVMW
jgi:hypothetical protein